MEDLEREKLEMNLPSVLIVLPLLCIGVGVGDCKPILYVDVMLECLPWWGEVWGLCSEDDTSTPDITNITNTTDT